MTGEELVRELLLLIGEDPARPGLLETPGRVVRSWEEFFCGYKQDPDELIKCFPDECEYRYTGMVVMEAIEFFSFCEHHMVPFFGKAYIGYIPSNGIVIGASKMARILDVFARRLQTQERLTQQVLNVLVKNLKPIGAGIVIRAKHLCISSRGAKKQLSMLKTDSFHGTFLEDGPARQEFLSSVPPTLV